MKKLVLVVLMGFLCLFAYKSNANERTREGLRQEIREQLSYANKYANDGRVYYYSQVAASLYNALARLEIADAIAESKNQKSK